MGESLLRRGLARTELGKLDEALADYREALRLEPANAQAAPQQRLELGHLGARPRVDAWGARRAVVVAEIGPADVVGEEEEEGGRGGSGSNVGRANSSMRFQTPKQLVSTEKEEP